MKSEIITMPTYTRALQAKRVLAPFALPITVVRLSASAREQGCSYGLEVPASAMQRVLTILSREGIAYRAVRDRESVL